MTVANQISIARLFLIPVFVGFAAYYAHSVKEGEPVETWRWAAVGVFLLAAVSDAADGYIARRFHQRTRLGVILDPLADKGLMLAAIITLSVTSWPEGFPLWFALVVVTRDVILITGTLLLHYSTGRVQIRPHWTGKTATCFQMLGIAWVMLRLPWPSEWVIIPAGLFTAVSGVIYIADGIRQIHVSDDGSIAAD